MKSITTQCPECGRQQIIKVKEEEQVILLKDGAKSNYSERTRLKQHAYNKQQNKTKQNYDNHIPK